MGSFRSNFSIEIIGHRHLSNESEWGNAKASHKSPKICLFSILQALISVRFASNQPHFLSPRTYLTSIILQKFKNIFFHLMMLKCFFSFWFIRSGILGNSWEVFSNLAFVILNPQPTWPFQYVRDWCGGDREFSKLVALKLSALSPCTPLLMLKYIKIYIKIWVILRCWGKSSMVCQQKSDAL